VAPPLESLPFRSPVHEPVHMFAIFPGKVKKLAGRQVGRFLAEKGLEAPAHIGTFPGIQPVTSRGIPVVLQCLKHLLRNGLKAQPSMFRL
jgi:hypothetical protein